MLVSRRMIRFTAPLSIQRKNIAFQWMWCIWSSHHPLIWSLTPLLSSWLNKNTCLVLNSVVYTTKIYEIFLIGIKIRVFPVIVGWMTPIMARIQVAQRHGTAGLQSIDAACSTPPGGWSMGHSVEQWEPRTTAGDGRSKIQDHQDHNGSLVGFGDNPIGARLIRGVHWGTSVFTCWCPLQSAYTIIHLVLFQQESTIIQLLWRSTSCKDAPIWWRWWKLSLIDTRALDIYKW